MVWSSIVGALLGAIIGLSGALVASIRSGQDQLRKERELQRRQVYVAFATALDTAHAGLRAIITGAPVPDRRAAVRAAIGDAGVYRTREQLLMFASSPVAIAGESAFLALIKVRDATAAAATVDSAEYHDAYHNLADGLWNLRMVVRADVGERPLSPRELDHGDWSERSECRLCAGPDSIGERT